MKKNDKNVMVFIMCQLIIYGIGKVFRQIQANLPWNQIIALADKCAFQDEYIHELPVVTPEKIIEYEYDYLVICSNKLFEDIQEEMITKLYVPEHKIISYKMLLEKQAEIDKETIRFFRDFVISSNCHLVWDADMVLLPRYYFNKKAVWGDADIELVATKEINYLLNKNLYIYSQRDMMINDCDIVFLGNQLEMYEKLFFEYVGRIKYIIAYIPCNKSFLDKLQYINKYRAQGVKMRVVSKLDVIFIIIDMRLPKNLNDTAIYVVTHKEYCIKNDGLYRPICVGNQYKNKEFLSEHTGDNISYLNDKINECTALYWIWKNSNKKWVGLNHYRRYFCNNNQIYRANILDEYRIEELLQQYDIILAETIPQFGITELEQIRNSIDVEAFEIGLSAMQAGIAKYQPDYSSVFEQVMDGHNAYLYNMFVTRKEIVDSYCEWLFSFLIEVAEKTDVSKYDSYSKRVIGFFAERMWTVWLTKQDLKVRELPHIMMR